MSSRGRCRPSRRSLCLKIPAPPRRRSSRHAAVEWDDAAGFLAILRRGESIGADLAMELLQALNALEIEYRDARLLDRRVAYALHRLAFEGQVLHTEAWPGALDLETVNLLRSVQEAVDRSSRARISAIIRRARES